MEVLTAHILLVEDDQTHAEMVQRAFDKSAYTGRFHLKVAGSLAEARNCQAEDPPAMVITDLMLPDGRGTELLPTNGEEVGWPVVVMTSHGDEQVAVEALKAGALDYVVKSPTTLADMPHLVERALREWGHITERRQIEEVLRKRTYQQQRLLETARYLTASLNPREVLTRIGLGARELLEAYGCAIYLLEDDGNTLTPVVALEPDIEEEILSATLSVDASLTGTAVKAQQGMIFNYAGSTPSSYHIPGTPVLEEEHVIVTPFVIDDKVLGAMCLSRIGKLFEEEDLALAETLATYAETALRNAQTHQALEQEVAERQEAEAALHRSMAELQARNEELDAFCHTVAHDLQNPLSIIIGMSDALLTEHVNISRAGMRRYLETLLQSSEKLSQIVEELLLLAQVRQGEVELDPVNTGSIVAEALQSLAGLIQDQEAVIHVPDAWPAALGYEPWIEQVWANYVSNAIKYGGQPPRVELGATPEPDGMIRFWVRDNGPGLTPEEQARLFTPFTRLDQKRAKGYGLGLSIVRRIVEKLGGQVGIESSGAPGLGCTFSFTLPGA